MPDAFTSRGSVVRVFVFCTLAILAGAERARAQTPPSPEDNALRLRAYHERLVQASQAFGPRVSLVDVLGPVMALARERSVPGRAADENRTALMALTFYVNNWNIAMLVPEARDWPRAARRGVTLRGRGDLAQHFIVSALIAAAGGTPLAAAAGLYKELSDARGGSGFSFSDLAADRAGERFGATAARSDESARRLQDRIGPGIREADLMPGIDGLVDNLSEAELARRFGGVGGPAYNAVVSDIDRRVDALALFQ